MWVVLIKYVKHLTFVLGYRVSQKELNLLLRFPEGLELFAGLPKTQAPFFLISGSRGGGYFGLFIILFTQDINDKMPKK